MPVIESLYPGLAWPWQALFTTAFTVLALMCVWTVTLFVRGGRAERRAPEPRDELTDGFTWVFLVPALNEELTIRDSVDRLLAIPVRNRRIVVIDDGSDDATARVLRDLAHPDLTVLQRRLPHARRGKAAALNHAFRHLADELDGVDRERVIVVVVDADGRLQPTAPRYAAAHFADRRVGGVQSLVRIYNRRRVLTWMQDVEFAVYGHLFQTGRNGWGTAGMGGNGQFNRLSALDDVADDVGPWRDRLTEDQDLGLRLTATGWLNRQDVRAVVEQQGLPRLRPLLRQRTRWSQGNLQAFGLTGALARAPLPLLARAEVLAYLFMPLWQGIMAAAFAGAVALAVLDEAPFWGTDPRWQIAVSYLLAFGGTVLAALASRRGRGVAGFVTGVLVGHAYALYTWTIWPVLVRSVARQATGRINWAKTAREPVDQAGEPAVVAVLHR